MDSRIFIVASACLFIRVASMWARIWRDMTASSAVLFDSFAVSYKLHGNRHLFLDHIKSTRLKGSIIQLSR